MARSARLLDLTRLVSRIGRGAATGVDRVEAAYLTRLLAEDAPLFALVHAGRYFYLFDRAGADALARRLSGDVAWSRPDLRARLTIRPSAPRFRADRDLRGVAVAHTRAAGLGAMLTQHLPTGAVWLNVGHSNLIAPMFDAVHSVDGGQAVVLVHDTIPLDHPDWQRPGTVESFRTRIEQVAQKADLVIHSADATRTQSETHFTAMGRVPSGVTAHLGIVAPRPDPTFLTDLGQNRPYFVVLGTIEPRKNHALLLDLWKSLPERLTHDEIPDLVILGERGWNNDAVFKRLDAKPPHIHELGPLSDGAVAQLLTGARALLMPSQVEGFGLPPGESLALGCPVIASDLPVYREVFGNNIVYVDPTDLYSWTQSIITALRTERGVTDGQIRLPTWDDHFNTVLNAL